MRLSRYNLSANELYFKRGHFISLVETKPHFCCEDDPSASKEELKKRSTLGLRQT